MSVDHNDHKDQNEENKQKQNEIGDDNANQRTKLRTKKKIDDSSVIKQLAKKTHKVKSYRDYLHLYDGKEKLAQLHLECMQAFKHQLIERCVEEEYQRIMSLRRKKSNDDNVNNGDKGDNNTNPPNMNKSHDSSISKPSSSKPSPQKPRSKHKKKVIEESSSDESSGIVDF